MESGARARQADGSPTVPPPRPPGMSPVLERNIRALEQRRRREMAQSSFQDKAADAITRFVGSMAFVYIHVVVFGFWTAVNAGLITAAPKWDESFVILGTFASVEAIFLSTFVLISQNRMAALGERRADLDLQVSLLAEHEVTRLVSMVAAISSHLGVHSEADQEVPELSRDVAPEAVLDELAAREDER